MASIRRYEQKLAAGRKHEEAMTQLNRALATDKMLGENFKSDGRVVQRRLLNESKAVAKDMYATQQLQSAALAQQREAILREQDERLAAELARDEEEMTEEIEVARL